MPICKIQNCRKNAHFNFQDSKIPVFCSNHFLTGMKRIGNLTCPCGLHVAQYNYINLPPVYCIFCKSEKMININNLRCKCRKHKPSFNFPEKDIPEYCNDCKFDGMILTKHKKKIKCLV